MFLTQSHQDEKVREKSETAEPGILPALADLLLQREARRDREQIRRQQEALARARSPRTTD